VALSESSFIRFTTSTKYSLIRVYKLKSVTSVGDFGTIASYSEMDNQPDCLELGLAPRIAATSVLERERESECVCVCVCVWKGEGRISAVCTSVRRHCT